MRNNRCLSLLSFLSIYYFSGNKKNTLWEESDEMVMRREIRRDELLELFESICELHPYIIRDSKEISDKKYKKFIKSLKKDCQRLKNGDISHISCLSEEGKEELV